MSEISHSDELVTKQDLSNFYQGILPYLGGMPDLLANKFSKSDLYSTDEKIVGQWIDGKPIYQKTFIDTMPETTQDGTVTSKTINIASLSLDKIIDASMRFTFDGTNQAVAHPVYYTNAGRSCRVNIWQGALSISNDYMSFNSVSIQITLQYTKTTDSSVEIGNETDYSTTEKIIGTWIDGKPLYQKTLTVTAPKVTTEGTSVTKATEHGISDMKAVREVFFNSYSPVFLFGNANSIKYMVPFADTANVTIRTNSVSYSELSLMVTLRYTKTTD